MDLLTILGLPHPAPRAGAARPTAVAEGVPSPLVGALAGSSGPGVAVKTGKVSSKVVDDEPDEADTAAVGLEPMGPRADGPDAEQLYALVGPDGSTLEAGKSKAGARLNELGESLAHSFARTKESYDAWQGKFAAVMKASTASAGELKKMQDAKKAFVSKADRNDDVKGSSEAFLRDSAAVKKAVRDVKPRVSRANAALRQVQLVLAGKEARSAEREQELQKQKYEDRKEEIKEQQERIKGALGLMTKFASVTEWIEILPDALAFANEQLFAELPKSELDQLKKNVEKATAKLYEAQNKQDSIALALAFDLLDAANQELDNAQVDMGDRMKDLARSQNTVIKKLANSDATRDAANAMAASRKMTELMAEAAKLGAHYLGEGTSLTAECERTGTLYAGYPAIVAADKKLVSAEAETMSRPAKTNATTLKTWVTYLRSVQAEVKDGVAACKDKSDGGYMKHYNKIGPLLHDMLSGK